MKSMTGYGYAEYQDKKNHFMLEIKSYNNRYLDMQINLPSFLSSIETEIRQFINKNAARGRVEIYLKVREIEEDIVFYIDKELAKSYSESLRELSNIAKLKDDIKLSQLLSFEGIIKEEKKHDIDEYKRKVFELIEKAFIQWEDSRIKEGVETLRDIYKNLDVIINAIDFFKEKVLEIEYNIKENIRMRLREVLGDDIAENRLLAETAILLVKYSINEEIVRLSGHIDSFKKNAESGGAVGKKLDFICQEINREINTIGSKSAMFEVNNMVVEVKDCLENIREQIRNIE